MNQKIVKALRKISRDLHAAIVEDQVRRDGSFLLKQNPDQVDQDGRPLNPAKKYVRAELREVDHFKVIKNLYKTSGIDAVGKYVVQQNNLYLKNIE